MIHAKELRFGNKVQTKKGEIITVQQIHADTLVYDTRLTLSRQLTHAAVSSRTAAKAVYTSTFVEEMREASLQEVAPIPLTPDLLEKCGFRNFVREEWIIRMGNSHIDFEFNDEGLRLRQPTYSRVSIRYLHQLQNFLYALGGYELQVDFTKHADRNNAN